MKAIVVNEPGGVENLVFTDIEKPIPQDQEVIVAVKAISINPVDVKVRAGGGIFQMLKTQKPLILGWDISGTVVEKGHNAMFEPGDEVLAWLIFPGMARATRSLWPHPQHSWH